MKFACPDNQKPVSLKWGSIVSVASPAGGSAGSAGAAVSAGAELSGLAPGASACCAVEGTAVSQADMPKNKSISVPGLILTSSASFLMFSVFRVTVVSAPTTRCSDLTQLAGSYPRISRLTSLYHGRLTMVNHCPNAVSSRPMESRHPKLRKIPNALSYVGLGRPPRFFEG